MKTLFLAFVVMFFPPSTYVFFHVPMAVLYTSLVSVEAGGYPIIYTYVLGHSATHWLKHLV